MLVGILFKVSAAPFHVWTPDVYEGAPSPVVALLSTAPKAAAFALLLRVVYEIFPTLRSVWSPLLWVVAVLSMTVGNLAALRQQNVKRMLAYSSIAHAGYLLAAFAGLGTSGIAAASFYIAAYAAMNVGIFAVVTLVSGYDEKLPLIEDFRGLIYRSPVLGRPADLLPGLAGRDSVHRRILRQVLLIFRRGGRRSDVAGDHRPAELGPGGGVLSAARFRVRAKARGGRSAYPDDSSARRNRGERRIGLRGSSHADSWCRSRRGFARLREWRTHASATRRGADDTSGHSSDTAESMTSTVLRHRR